MLKDILVEKGMPESTAAKFIEDFKPIYDSEGRRPHNVPQKNWVNFQKSKSAAVTF